MKAEKVRCEKWETCKDKSCLEKEPHKVRRDGRSSCRRKTVCATTGIVCGCVPTE